MARFVLLEFESNAQADAFVAKVQRHTSQGARYTVLGVFAKARNFCKCGHLSELQHKNQVQRGAKYGWYIHMRCGRPRRLFAHSAMVNLLGNRGVHVSVQTRPEEE